MVQPDNKQPLNMPPVRDGQRRVSPLCVPNLKGGKAFRGSSKETTTSRLRRQHAQTALKRSLLLPKTTTIKNLPWTSKDFDVRAWQKQEEEAVTRAAATVPADVLQVLQGNVRGEVTLPKTPFRPKIEVRKGHFGAKREGNKRHFVEGWLTQLGLNCDGNRDMVGHMSRQVGKRLKALGVLDIHGDTPLAAYDELLRRFPGEWAQVPPMARVHYTEFNRNKCFSIIVEQLLPPRLAAAVHEERSTVDVWCAGCSSGEEPYSLALHWHTGGQGVATDLAAKFVADSSGGAAAGGSATPQKLALRIVATDVSEECVEKAKRGQYDASPWASFGRLPALMRSQTSMNKGRPQIDIPAAVKGMVTFMVQDLKVEQPEGCFDIILCRNCAFMYFDKHCQQSTLQRFADSLRPGGYLIIGKNDQCIEDLEACRFFVRVESSNHSDAIRMYARIPS